MGGFYFSVGEKIHDVFYGSPYRALIRTIDFQVHGRWYFYIKDDIFI